MSAVEPHRATITVEWHPSASVGEREAIRRLLESSGDNLMALLLDYGVVDPCVSLDTSGKHGYLSTACWHATHDDLTDDARTALHRQCRRLCKYGGEPCACTGCDHTGIEDRPGRELHRGPTGPLVTGEPGSLVTAVVDQPVGSTVVVYAAADPDVCPSCARGDHNGCDGCRCGDRGHYGLDTNALGPKENEQ